ncbi:outer membrane beta-barrel protein [Marivirga salinae]|uniref:Outer membrane beta-barrel protein n=1 Tax=Marivirga salinarum TaxID=3059078 RepID=A0AA51N9R5_9BACT|nr:TonB-dependent receptor [Marivirga sp. BDSF4-3]WMN11064.1 outer membrane beta-barrel protein [Marivirga sp. BDSF4-3]
MKLSLKVLNQSTIVSAFLHLKLIICFIIFSFSLIAQKGTAQIIGSLLNQNQEPIGFSTVALFDSDSVLKHGAISELNGNFILENVTSGVYTLVIKNIEYSPFSIPNLKVVENEVNKLGAITLEKASTNMDEVVVTGKRELLEVHPDKIVLNVANSINASGRNGLEVMRSAPGVIIDPDNNIILQGKSGVRIFINGRPSRLSGGDLATFLQSMQSDNIEAIEVITNPGAKYEAEGNGGIINIRLKNNVNLGYNGNLTHSSSIGKEPRMSNGLTFNYGKDKLGITANLTRFDNVFSRAFLDNRQQEGFEVNLLNTDRSIQQGYNFSTSITYTINKKHSVNFSSGAVLTDGDFTVKANTDIYRESTPVIDQLLISKTLTDLNSDNLNYNLNHQWKLSESSSLSTDLSYGRFRKGTRIYQPNDYYEAGGTVKIGEVNNGFDTDTNIDLYSVKTDYEKTFDKFNISAGFKYYQVETVNDFIVSNVVENEYFVDESRSNIFNYTEQVAAAYLNSKFSFSKNLKANVGIRVENTASQGILESSVATENDHVIRNYTNFFPNVGLAYTRGRSDFNIGYGKRIARPNYEQLNPFEQKESELFIFKGNPFLSPSYTTNYQLTYSFDKALVISNTYSVTEGYFATINETDGAVAYFVPQNMQSTTNYGFSISYPVQIAKWWEASYFATYNRRTYDGDFEQATIDLDVNIYSGRSQNSFKLPLDLTMDVSVFYNSPWIWRGSVEVGAYSGVDIGLKKMFLKDKLQVILNANDVFNGYTHYTYTGEYGGMTMQGIRSFDNQRFGISLTYKFGNQQIKSRKRRGGLDDELNRIAD